MLQRTALTHVLQETIIKIGHAQKLIIAVIQNLEFKIKYLLYSVVIMLSFELIFI